MNADKRMAVTAITVLFGLGFARALIVDKGLPSRRFFLGSAVAGFLLTLLTDIRGDLGRWFSYAIILGATITHTEAIANELGKLEKGAMGDKKGAAGQPGQDSTMLVAAGTDAPGGPGSRGLPPVFLRTSGSAGSAGQQPYGTVARRQNTRQRLRTQTY